MRIDVVHLRRYFGDTRAVDDISFSFESGQVFGFVGPNGAGKTTAMRIMATLDEPTDGDCFIDGISVVEDPEKARRLIGFMPDHLPAHRDMTVDHYLDFFARAYGIKGETRRNTVERIEQFTNLLGIRHKTLQALSKGMKQRVSLARALVHDPPVLIMDEPAAGLDPRARVELRELLRILASQGKAILISSHILTELAELCNGAVIIEQGRILRAGTIDGILDEDETHRTYLIRTLDDPASLHRYLLERPHVLAAQIIGDEVGVEIEGDDDAWCNLLKELVTGDFRILEFRQRKAGLEELFMNVTKGMVQ